jgi:hypothetical protein
VQIFLDLCIPAGAEDWFERAVDCAAFLAWSVVQKEARVRFRTQEFDVCVPAEADVYTILKYLALVLPKAITALVDPGDEDSYAVVFTARPKDLEEAGWTDALVLGPADLPVTGVPTELDKPAARP